jgi:CDP-glucose 4,6-dehydratase
MGMTREFWRGKRVFITGHTGFKGGWLSTWLTAMEARVYGYALPPHTEPSYFALCGLEQRVESTIGNVCDAAALSRSMQSAQPEIVFHLAAQPIVRRSYENPPETFSTNVGGTVNVLEAIRHTPSVRAAVIVTSDKCYENREQLWSYREHDRLGGHDPYSASKACAELVAEAYRKSFFDLNGSKIALATARAGNVIGGGDWSKDRLVPDAIRALVSREPLMIRNPDAVRPWQHVLEPLAGYLTLAERLHEDGRKWSGAWNFGPPDSGEVSVAMVADKIIARWGEGEWRRMQLDKAPHEATYLKLDSSKSRALLGWRPLLDLNETVEMTADWYRKASSSATENMFEISRGQIESYESRSAGGIASGFQR